MDEDSDVADSRVSAASPSAPATIVVAAVAAYATEYDCIVVLKV